MLSNQQGCGYSSTERPKRDDSTNYRYEKENTQIWETKWREQTSPRSKRLLESSSFFKKTSANHFSEGLIALACNVQNLVILLKIAIVKGTLNFTGDPASTCSLLRSRVALRYPLKAITSLLGEQVFLSDVVNSIPLDPVSGRGRHLRAWMSLAKGEHVLEAKAKPI